MVQQQHILLEQMKINLIPLESYLTIIHQDLDSLLEVQASLNEYL